MLLAAGVLYLGWRISRPRPPAVAPRTASLPTSPSASPTPAPELELPPPSATPFLNAGTGADYVGKEACIACHEDQYRSYLQTSHSRALEDIDPAREPRDAEFDHPASGRHYSVFRQAGEFRHREELRTADGRLVVAVEHPLRYAIGSGHFSRSFLAEIDGFLIESPVTWYAAKESWAMSPGYDDPRHSSFERIADLGCIHCHAGRASPHSGNRYRVAIHEKSIGCESCHGPGSLHVSRHDGAASGSGEGNVAPGADLTIVHPGRLGRDQSEAICAQCHLRGAASVAVRGRRLLDFRPGLRLTDFRIDFVPERGSDAMTVVGHVEQMRASACYQRSDSLTCTTCHDPHRTIEPQQQVAYYRDRCNACHDGNCGLEQSVRLERSSDDNCASCHMPQRPTDLPHFAFTHHRIGLHEAEAEADKQPSSQVPGKLVSLADLTPFAPADRQRLLGLAYLQYVDLHAPPEGALLRRRGQEHLRDAWNGGARSADVAAILARFEWQQEKFLAAVAWADQALALPELESGAHADALFILGDSYLQMGRYASAEEMLLRLAQQRRLAEPWSLVGRCRMASGNFAGAAEAFRTAATIDPFRFDLQESLADSYRALGNLELAKQHDELAGQLRTSVR